MLCQICNEEEAAYTIIPTGEGLPQTLGVTCIARWVLEGIKDVLPAQEIAAALGPMFVGPAAASRELDSTPKRSAKKGKRTAKLGAQPDPDGGPPEGAQEDPDNEADAGQA